MAPRLHTDAVTCSSMYVCKDSGQLFRARIYSRSCHTAAAVTGISTCQQHLLLADDRNVEIDPGTQTVYYSRNYLSHMRLPHQADGLLLDPLPLIARCCPTGSRLRKYRSCWQVYTVKVFVWFCASQCSRRDNKCLLRHPHRLVWCNIGQQRYALIWYKVCSHLELVVICSAGVQKKYSVIDVYAGTARVWQLQSHFL